MAESTEYLIAVIGADVTAFRRGMREVRHELGVLDAETGQALQRVGRTLTYTLTTPLLIAGGAIAKSASDFDASMRNINSIAFLSEGAFNDLSASVLDFGKNTRDGATSAANSLYSIYSAGMSGQIAMDLMKVATKTAEAGLSDMTVTSEAMVAAMLSFGFTTEEEAWRVSNALTRMVQVGVGSMQQFAGSIATFMPSAAALGVQIEEAFAINARLTQMGYSASEAAVRTNAAMRSMIKPTQAMQDAFRKLGVRGTQELIEKSGGLLEALIALRGTTDGTEESLAKLFSDTRALQGVLLLTQNIDASRNSLKEFNAAVDGSTMRAWQEQVKSFAYQWDRAKSALSGFAITLGQQLLPILAPVVSNITNFLIGLTELDAGTLRLTLGVGALVAALGPLIWLVGSLISPFGVLVGAVAGVKHAFDVDFKGITTIVQDVVTEVGRILQPAFKVLEDFWNLFLPPEQRPEPIDYFPELRVGAPVITMSHTVQQGDTLWDIWQQYFPTGEMTWEDFKTKIGIDPTVTINPGDIIKIQSDGTTTVPPADKQKIVDYFQGWMDEATGGEAFTSPVERFFGMFGNDTARAVLFRNLKVAFDDAIPKLITVLDEKGGELFTALASGFSTAGSTGDGKTKMYDGLRGAIDGTGDLLSGGLAEKFPALSAGLSTLLTNMGEWLKTEGVPTLSRAFGYVIGRVGALMGEAIGAIGGALSGQGGAISSTLNESLAQPFSQGFSDAMADAGVSDQNWIDTMLTGLAGAIGTYAILHFGIFGLAAAGIQAAFGMAMAVAKWPISIAASFLTGMVAPLASAIPAVAGSMGLAAKLGTALTNFFILNPVTAGIALAAASYFIMSDETKESLRTGFWGLIAGIIGAPPEEVQREMDEQLSRGIMNLRLLTGGYTTEEVMRVKIAANFEFGEIGGKAGTQSPFADALAKFIEPTPENMAFMKEKFGGLAEAYGLTPEALQEYMFGNANPDAMQVPLDFEPMQMTEEDRAKFLAMVEQRALAFFPEKYDDIERMLINFPIEIVPDVKLPSYESTNTDNFIDLAGMLPEPTSIPMPVSIPWWNTMLSQIDTAAKSPDTMTKLGTAAQGIVTSFSNLLNTKIAMVDSNGMVTSIDKAYVGPFRDAFYAGLGPESTVMDPVSNISQEFIDAFAISKTEITTATGTLPAQLITLKGALQGPLSELTALWDAYWRAVQGPEGYGPYGSNPVPSNKPPVIPAGREEANGLNATKASNSAMFTATSEEGGSYQNVQIDIHGVQNVDRMLEELRRRGIVISHGRR